MTGGHQQKHLDEARGVTTSGAREQVEIQLGHVCNNRCNFCVSGQMTEQRLARPIPADPVFEALEAARARGATKVTFLGGEPTIQKSFLPSLKRAVELGYDDIVIFTNGVKARRREFIEEVVALGRFTWRFSIQGANEAAHDLVTGRRGAFARIVAGMEVLQELGQDVTANMCVNEDSYRSLPDFPELLSRHGVRQLHIDMIRPADAGVRTDAYLQRIMPRYSDMAPYFAQMLEGFEAVDPDFDVNVGNLPYCVLPRWAHRIHHDGELTMTVAVSGDSELSEPWNKYEVKRHDKAHPPACDGCVFRAQCNGIFDKYAQFYGVGEFAAVTREQLAALDRDMNFFVQLVEPAIAPLLGEHRPARWRLDRVFRSTRDRRVEIAFRGPGGRATLVLSPPEGVGRPVDAPPAVLEADRLRLGLRLDRGVDPDALLDLVLWAQAALESTGELALTRRVDPRRVLAGMLSRDRLARGEARIRKMAELVRRRGAFGPDAAWSLAGAEPLETKLGTRLLLSGPGGARVDLELVLQADPKRPPVGVSYRLGEGTAPETARPVLSDVMGALRA